MMRIPSIYVSILLGFPELRVCLSQSSQHVYEEREQLSGHERGQAKHRNKEWEGSTKKQTSSFPSLLLKMQYLFPKSKKGK